MRSKIKIKIKIKIEMGDSEGGDACGDIVSSHTAGCTEGDASK